MGVTYVKEVISPEELFERYPLPEAHKKLKAEKDKEIAKVFTGESDKFLVIVGPCSADNEDAVCDYTTRLAKVQEKVADKLIIIPRIYTNKPRTTGEGYKGIVHQLTISGIDIPCGMKNPTSGTLSIMLNSCIAAQGSHTFMYRGWEVKSDGNPLAHTILRGAINKHDQSLPNYHYEDLTLLNEMYHKLELKNPACIVDANHANSNKCFYEQPRIVSEVLHSRSVSKDIEKLVKGVMIESYIEEGNQKIGEGIYGKSITDPCLGWNDTEKLIYEIADRI